MSNIAGGLAELGFGRWYLISEGDPHYAREIIPSIRLSGAGT